VVIKKVWPAVTFDVNSNDRAITLSTTKLRVVIERESGAIHYIVPEGATGAGATGPGSTGGAMRGKMLTTDGYRSLRPVEVNGEKTFHAEVSFPIYGSHEGFYGLGSTRPECGTIAGDSGPVAGEHQHRGSTAGFDEWIRDLLE